MTSFAIQGINRESRALLRAFMTMFVMSALLMASCAAFAVDRVLSWDAVTTDSIGNPLPAGVTVTYNVYGAVKGATPKLLANVATTSTTRVNVDVGTACYYVTALVTPASAVTIQDGIPTMTICDTVTAPATPTGFTIQHAATAANVTGPPSSP